MPTKLPPSARCALAAEFGREAVELAVAAVQMAHQAHQARMQAQVIAWVREDLRN